MTKPLTCLVLLLGFSLGRTSAQNGVLFEPVLTVEYARNTVDNTHLNDFFNSYNSFHAADIVSPWEEIGKAPFAHMQYRAGFWSLVGNEKIGFYMASNLVWGKGREKREVTLSNGLSQELDMTSKARGWDVHVGIGGARWYLTTLMTAYAHVLDFKLYTVFPDGSRSMGNLFKISGHYSGLLPTLDVGLGAGVNIGPVALVAKVENPLSNFPPGRYLITLDDYDSSDEYPLTDLPRDYALWVTDPVTLGALAAEDDQQVMVLTDAFTGLRFSVGLEFSPSRLLR